MTALTRRQQQIYDYLRAHADAPAPSLDELCRALGLRSRGSLHKHIRALVDAGLVEPLHGRQRGVRLAPGSGEDTDTLPLLGYIAAGRPIEALANPEPVSVPPALRTQRPCYVLEVRGDSMIDAGILDGDWVVIEQREGADNGDIVVALIDESDATLKRFEARDGQIVLHPSNPTMAPLRYAPERVRIQGVLTGQMRRYR